MSFTAAAVPSNTCSYNLYPANWLIGNLTLYAYFITVAVWVPRLLVVLRGNKFQDSIARNACPLDKYYSSFMMPIIKDLHYVIRPCKEYIADVNSNS